jgi:hypothetical protein
MELYPRTNRAGLLTVIDKLEGDIASLRSGLERAEVALRALTTKASEYNRSTGEYDDDYCCCIVDLND